MFAEQHAGEDLKTTIVWCSARAEALARMGDSEQALSFARHAVALAEPTDALADKADASLALARALHAAEMTKAPRAQAAAQAKAWYEAKGHVVGAQWAAALAGPAQEAAAPTAPADEARPASSGDRPPERLWRELARRWAADDIDALLELYAEDWLMTDHRAMGWEPQRGRAQARAVVESVFAIAPDIRLDIDEVLACDERVIAMRVAYRGHAADGSGYAEYPVGYVAVVENGISVSIDQYDHDDDQSMIARYAELGGGLGPLGNRPPERVVEAVHAALRRTPPRANAGALRGGLRGRGSPQHAAGRRPAGARPRPSVCVRSGPRARHFHVEIEDVLACDDRVIALRLTWHGDAADRSGGGRFTVPMCVVGVTKTAVAALGHTTSTTTRRRRWPGMRSSVGPRAARRPAARAPSRGVHRRACDARSTPPQSTVGP